MEQGLAIQSTASAIAVAMTSLLLLFDASLPARAQLPELPTDDEIRRALADLPRDPEQPPPTVVDFRSMQVMEGSGQVRSATLEEFRESYAWGLLPYRLASKYYPRVLTDVDTPDGLKLAFLLKDRETVIRHASAVVSDTAGGSLLSTLERIFPELRLPRGTHHGSQCFAPIAGKRGGFCVYHAVLP
jgi:hypothetical protein